MIKNSIELAQVLSEICLEQYVQIFYKIVEKAHSCLKAQNTLFIYVSSQRHGMALDFAIKLANAQKTVKNAPFIMPIEFVTQFENNTQEHDVLLLLDENKEILEIAKQSSIATISLCEFDIDADIKYKIPSQNKSRVEEVQKVLLNSIAENCLKFLP